MNPAPPQKSRPARVAIGLLILMTALVAGGCRRDSSNDNPTPTPSPSPTASPSPTPTFAASSPSAAAALSEDVSSDPSAEVIRGNAELIHAAALDALHEVVRLEGLVALIAPASDADLSVEGLALATAHHAFLQAGSAVYYPDPDTGAEWALPFGSLDSAILAETPGFAPLSQSLAEYPALPRASFGIPGARSQALETLLAETQALRAALQDFVDAWEPGLPDNFRNRHFLPDPTSAIKKIFQGLLAVTDQLILERSAAASDRARLIGRLEGIKVIYDGQYATLQYTTVWTPGLKVLVQRSEPSAAASLSDTIDRLLESWGDSDPLPDEDRSPSLEDLRKQIIGAAEQLGYPVDSLPQVRP